MKLADKDWGGENKRKKKQDRSRWRWRDRKKESNVELIWENDWSCGAADWDSSVTEAS